MPSDDLTTAERATRPHVQHKLRRKDHSSSGGRAAPEVYAKYTSLLQQANALFLQRQFYPAAVHAAHAARIYPTSQIFALLSAINEGLGHFDRALDFRLLQAFMSRDAVLWKELLSECLERQLFFKATVCLHRLSALEMRDAFQYRSLQIQLADLYMGLGEIQRASRILNKLWVGSTFRDFEVFSLLSSLYFQLGRWNALSQLLTESLEGGFKKKKKDTKDNSTDSTVTCADLPEEEMYGLSQQDTEAAGVAGATATNDGTVSSCTISKSSVRRRTKKKSVTFMTQVADVNTQQSEAALSQLDADEDGGTSTVVSSFESIQNNSNNSNGDGEANEDDFNFEDGEAPTPSPTFSTPPIAEDDVTAVMREWDLRTKTAKKNFLTLVNVHSELLNEQGKFDKSIRLLQQCAALLEVPLFELPPDLLLRYGVACAYLGNSRECGEVFEQLLMTCPLANYSDALYDAAVTLQHVGMHADSVRVLMALRRFHKPELDALQGELLELLAEEDGNNVEETPALRSVVDSSCARSSELLPTNSQLHSLQAKAAFAERQRVLEGEIATHRTTHVALSFHIAKSLVHLDRVDEAIAMLQEIHAIDKSHVGTRLELAHIYQTKRRDLDAAEAVLSPQEADDAFMVVQLSAALLPLLQQQKKYVDAISIGVGLFQLLLADNDALDEGDRLSTYSGATSGSRSQRSSLRRYAMPTLTRTASSIISSNSIADMVGGGEFRGAASSAHSIAASFVSFASASVASRMARRGGLTSTAAGSHAATSVAGSRAAGTSASGVSDAPWTKKDASALFSFHRKRQQIQPRTPQPSMSAAARQKRQEEAQRRVAEYQAKYATTNNDATENASSGGGSIGDVAELEEMERLLQDAEDDHRSGDEPPRQRRRTDDSENAESPAEAEAPEDLEAVAQRCFDDPSIGNLFVLCTQDPTATQPAAGEQAPVVMEPPRTPTGKEVLQLVGRSKLIDLAVAVVDCYIALERYDEGKEFANVVLTAWGKQKARRYRTTTDVPLRLAVLRCSFASGKLEDTMRLALAVLSDDDDGGGEQQSKLAKDVLRALHGILENGDTSSDTAVRGSMSYLHRQMFEGRSNNPAARLIFKKHPVPFLVLRANEHMHSRSYRRALNYFLLALSLRPDEPYLNFIVAVTYACTASNRVVAAVSECVSASFYYLERYRRLMLREQDRPTGMPSLSPSSVLEATVLAPIAADDFAKTMDDAVFAGKRGISDFLTSFGFHAPSTTFSQQSTSRGSGSERSAALEIDDEIVVHARRVEVAYNTARLFHYLQLHYLATPLYEDVLAMCDRCLARRNDAGLSLHPECSDEVSTYADEAKSTGRETLHFRASSAEEEDLSAIRARAYSRLRAVDQMARLNLYLICMKVSENPLLALSVLQVHN